MGKGGTSAIATPVERSRRYVVLVAFYFCDPHSPWQRGSNENTNGLLRQYFPKTVDLSAYTGTDLAAVARQLNTLPGKR